MIIIIRTLKNIFVHIRASIKVLLLIVASAVIILAAVKFIYRPMYSVTFQGNFVGYVQDKDKLKDKIEEYKQKGDGGALIAYVDIPEVPSYKVCLLKKDKVANDEEIFNMVKETGTVYYRYYAVTESDQEKYYVTTTADAESVIQKLKDKNSTNSSKIAYIEKTVTELTDFTDVDTIVSKLYVEPVRKTYYVATTGSVGADGGTNSSKGVDIGMYLSKPTVGTLTSRFGGRWGAMHTGIDVANNTGTNITAAAAGTVKFTGWYGGYGNLVIVSHGGGVETYYAHCSSILVSAGQKVSQGQSIAKMGSTGNSTGPHLHFEVRVNGVAQNPQTYVYK